MDNSTNDLSESKEFTLGSLVGCGATFVVLGAGYLIRRCLQIDKALERVGPAPDSQQLNQTDQDWMTAVKLYGASESLRWQLGLPQSSEESSSSLQRGLSDELQSSFSGQPSVGGNEPRLFALRRQEAVDKGSLQSSQSEDRSTDGSGTQTAPSNQSSSSQTTQPSSSGTGSRNDPPLTEYKHRSKYGDIIISMSPEDFRLPRNQSPVDARFDFIKSTVEKMKKAIPSTHVSRRTDDIEMGTMRPVAEEEPRPGPSSAY